MDEEIRELSFSNINKSVKLTATEINQLTNEHSFIAKKLFPTSTNDIIAKKRFSKKLLKNMYIEYKYNMRRNKENIISIKFEYFSTEQMWNEFLRKISLKTTATLKPLKKILIVDNEIALDIENCFKSILNNNKEEYQEKVEISDDLDPNHLDEDGCIVSNGELLKFNKHTTMAQFIKEFDNTDGDFRIKFNEDVEVSDNWNTDSKNSISTHKIRIRKKMKNLDFKMALKFGARCGKCNQLLEFDAYQLNNKDIGHMCLQDLTAKGDPKFVKLNRSAIKYLRCKGLHMYEANVLDDIRMKNEKYYFFSLNPNIKRGNYMANIITDDFSNITAPGGKKPLNLETYSLILATKPIGQEVELSLFDDTKKDVDAWCKERNLPYSKLIHTTFMFREYYRKYRREKIDDRGMLLQVVSCFSAISRVHFNYRMFAISAIGETSISKTFMATRIIPALDEDYKFISGGKNTLSVPGMLGGINNGAVINGERVSMFEEGIISEGSVIFDEGEDFYDMDLGLNGILKDNFNGSVTLQKIGGSTANITFTPLIFMNFYKYHKEEYAPLVRKAYKNSLVADRDSISDTSNHGINQFLKDKNIYYPEELIMVKYGSKHLLEAICVARMQITNLYRDWRTGGSLASANRMFFEILIADDRITNGKRIRNKSNITFPDPYELDTQKLVETIRKYLDVPSIDVVNYENNTEKNKQLLDSLEKSAFDFAYSDDQRMIDITKVMGVRKKNTVEMDSKLEVLFIQFLMILQLIEDSTAKELSETVKIYAHVICTKLKRGITSDEYDLKDNSYRPTFDYSDDFSLESLQAMMDEAEEQEKIERQMKVDIRREEQEKEKEKERQKERNDDFSYSVSLPNEEGEEEE